MIKIKIIAAFLFFIPLVLGQNEKQVYFSDSLFCIVEFNKKDSLWHIVKDGVAQDSIESWSFGTISKLKDSIHLKCFFTYNHKIKESKCDELIWSKKISKDKFYSKTQVANSQKQLDLLPELTTRFVTNYYWFINTEEHATLTKKDRNETIKHNKCLDLFLDYFKNDSLEFIRRIVSYLDSNQINFHERAYTNFEMGNYEEALFYSKIYSSLKDSLNYDEKLYDKKFDINYIYEVSMIHHLNLQHEYAYFNPYNYVLLDKFEQSKKLFRKTKRYGDVWWND